MMFLLASLALFINQSLFNFNDSAPLDNPPGFAVASAHPLATTAGLKILAEGGNAFDAAIAVGAVLSVVAPYHSGLGGGGFWLLYEAKDKKTVFIDGRETAPLKAHKNMFLNDKGEVIPGLSINGGLAAAIPGEPAAFAYLAKHYGKLPLKQSLAPAIKIAEEGFLVDNQFYQFILMDDRLDILKRYPETAAILLKDGKPYPIGERLKQPELAKTLRIFAEQGHDGFYKGEVAKQLVAGINAAGGVWSLADLANYQVKIREPLITRFQGLTISTVPPPSAGGVALITMLNILSNYSLDSLPKAVKIHYIVEAMRLSFWQRSQYLGDPDFNLIPLDELLSIENAKKLSAMIPVNRALNSEELAGQGPRDNSGNTTHVSILDNEGNRVSATMTVNFIFGSSVIPKGTGILINDEMDDFSLKTGVRNVYGIVGTDKNAIEPGKRPLSSMTPVFLEIGDRLAILGTPGGSRIPTMVLLAALVFKDYGGAISMVSAMRFHHQYLPDWLQVEPNTFSPELEHELKKMGYKIMLLKQYYGDMQAISFDKNTGLITAASDPRRIGLAATLSTNASGYGFKH